MAAGQTVVAGRKVVVEQTELAEPGRSRWAVERTGLVVDDHRSTAAAGQIDLDGPGQSKDVVGRIGLDGLGQDRAAAVERTELDLVDHRSMAAAGQTGLAGPGLSRAAAGQIELAALDYRRLAAPFELGEHRAAGRAQWNSVADGSAWPQKDVHSLWQKTTR